MNVQLYINNQLCDLKGDESIEVDYSIFDISKIGSRGGARSYEFQLPKTNNNKLILENPEIVNNLSIIPYSRLDARVFVEGVDVLIRFAEVSKVKDAYNIRLYGSNSDIFAPLKDLKMIDLRLCQYDHFWNLSNIANSRINSNGYIYPVIDYHKDSPNSYISNSDKVVRADYMLPAMYYNTLVDEVMNETGFLFVNKLASYSDDIIIPYSGNNLLRNKQGSRYEATFRASKDTLLNVLMPATPSVSFGNWVFFDTLDVGNNCGSYWSAGNYTKFTNGLGDNIFLKIGRAHV